MVDRNMVKIICIIFSMLYVGEVWADGLLFNGNDRLIEERTSYQVFADKSPRFSERMTINFKLSVLKQASFGNIFRLVDKESGTVYSLVYTRNNDTTSYVRFNIGDKENRITIVMYNSEIKKGRWFDVTLDFMLDKDSLNLSIDECHCGAGELKLSRTLQPDIYFGKHAYSIDVLGMAIKDLNVTGKDKAYYFPLNENSGDEVHDKDGDAVGKVSNPNWLINDSYFWEKRFSYHSGSVTGAVFDEKNQRLLFFNQDSLITYDVNNDQVSASVYKNKLPVPMVLGMNFYLPEEDRLYVYEVNGVKGDGAKVASLDLNAGEWRMESREELPDQRHHHSAYYDPAEQMQFIFGGFGDRKYFNEFVAYDLKSKVWSLQEFTGDRIAPRMFSGMGTKDGNELYIFGGNGNEQGEQSIGKVHYVDLYKVDLDKRHITKLWDLGQNTKLMIPARQLMFTPDTGFIYALYYPPHLPHTYLQLYRFSLSDGRYDVLADSIPMLSEAIKTNANLWFNRDTEEIYCCTLEFNDLNEDVQVSFYSLQYPAGVPVFPHAEKGRGGIGWILAGVAGGCAVLLLAALLLWRRKRSCNSAKAFPAEAKGNVDESSLPVKERENRKNALYLFGDPAMYNKDGRDITYLLSTKLRQLFCFILLNSDSEKDGVTSEEIYSAIWPDKPVQNAKNLKGVTIANLRKVLEDVEGVELVFEKGKFLIKPDERFYCDYFVFVSLVKRISTQQEAGNIDEVLMEQLLSVLSAGKFLQTLNDECFDVFKQNYEELVISFLYWKIEKDFAAHDFNKVLLICNLFSYIDPLNEVALWYELQALFKLHQINAAKRRFRIFVDDYRKIMDDEYTGSFERMIKSRTPDSAL